MGERLLDEVLEKQRFDENPGATDLAGRHPMVAGQGLQRLRVHLEQLGGMREVERRHGSGLGKPAEGTADVPERVYVGEDALRIASTRFAAGQPPGRRQANPRIPLDQSDCLGCRL